MADKIVVVDDDLMSLRMAKRVFDKADMDCRCLSSGAEAFAYLNGDSIPDLVLLDVHMPDANGFDILKRLKSEPAYRGVPVVFLTGDDDVKSAAPACMPGRRISSASPSRRTCCSRACAT